MHSYVYVCTEQLSFSFVLGNKQHNKRIKKPFQFRMCVGCVLDIYFAQFSRSCTQIDVWMWYLHWLERLYYRSFTLHIQQWLVVTHSVLFSFHFYIVWRHLFSFAHSFWICCVALSELRTLNFRLSVSLFHSVSMQYNLL